MTSKIISNAIISGALEMGDIFKGMEARAFIKSIQTPKIITDINRSTAEIVEPYKVIEQNKPRLELQEKIYEGVSSDVNIQLKEDIYRIDNGDDIEAFEMPSPGAIKDFDLPETEFSQKMRLIENKLKDLQNYITPRIKEIYEKAINSFTEVFDKATVKYDELKTAFLASSGAVKATIIRDLEALSKIMNELYFRVLKLYVLIRNIFLKGVQVGTTISEKMTDKVEAHINRFIKYAERQSKNALFNVKPL